MNWNPRINLGQKTPSLAQWPKGYFSPEEMRCQQTKRYPQLTEEVLYFLSVLNRWRETFGQPMRVTSGYRHPDHFIERKKTFVGSHAYGVAVDIAARDAAHQFELLLALLPILTPEEYRRSGIGISQKKSPFIHFDLWGFQDVRPNVWTY